MTLAATPVPEILQFNVDVAVVGAGTAGLAAYRAAKREGASTLLIEGGPYGTTCARVGCMPSKLLIAAAEAVHASENFADFGIDIAPPRVDGVRVMQRVRFERDRFVGFVLEGVEAFPSEDKLRGYARFLDSHTLLVDLERPAEAGQTQAHVSCKSIVLATGSSPHIPAELLPAGDRLLVNDDIFSWTDLPRSVFVLGAGVIGLELGQALARLGVKVTLLGRGGHIGGISDPVVREAAHSIIGNELHYIPDGSLMGVERLAPGAQGSDNCTGLSIRWRDAQDLIHETVVDYILAASGRRPNLERLGLESVLPHWETDGVVRFDAQSMQIQETVGREHLFIAGDANATLTLLHEAADEGSIAGMNAARVAKGWMPLNGKRRSFLGIVFTDPNIAVVGSSYKQLDPQSIVIGEVSYADQGRARVMLVNKGVLRVYADKTSHRFLGAEMISPRAEHLAHLLAWSHQMQLTIEQMLAMPFYHPVIEEGLRTALRNAAAQF